MTDELSAYWDTYEKLAFRTNADLKHKRLNNQHMLSGILTELGELGDIFKKNLAYHKPVDWKNVKEEVGDIFWYIAGLVYFNPYLRVTLKNLLGDYDFVAYERKPTQLERVLYITKYFSTFVFDGVNKIIHPSDFADFISALLEFCKYNEFDVMRIMQNNIEKLQARYPDKFTSEHALNRNLEREEQILDE